MDNEKYIIKVDGINKSFGNRQVLCDVTLGVRKSEICGIVGHNGSGKTVLFKCICGLLYTDSGKISLDGKILHEDMDMIENAGVIIEEPAILGNYSGYRNLDYLYRIRNRKNPKRIYEVMKMVGLNPMDKKRAKNYSMGMKQRLSIAQAIMENPDILILDEPMNGLDKNGVSEMRKLFLRQRDEGKTIIMASHNKEDIEILCDHVYEMEMGVLNKLR